MIQGEGGLQSRRHLVLERAAHRLRLALDNFDQRARRAGRIARAKFPLAHGADASADDSGKFALRQAESVPRQARIGVAGDDGVHDRAGLLAGDEVAQFFKAGKNIVGQAASFRLLRPGYFLRHDAMISFKLFAISFRSRAVRSAFSFLA